MGTGITAASVAVEGEEEEYPRVYGALELVDYIVYSIVREVFEETGIEAEFQALACFRHWHGYRYGKSDIYFVCRLKALTEQIKMGEKEIEECLQGNRVINW